MSDIAGRVIQKAEDEGRLFRLIIVTGEYDGFHWYEGAPEEVAFLKNRHRHLFKWRAEIQVFHDERELEFFMVKATINRQIIPFITQIDNLGSCEEQAARIVKGLINMYGADRWISVEVSEDGENGGAFSFNPDRSKF